jgi:hypothetical protein
MPSRRNSRMGSTNGLTPEPIQVQVDGDDEFDLLNPADPDHPNYTSSVTEPEDRESDFQRFAEALSALEFELLKEGNIDQVKIGQYLNEMSELMELGYLLDDNQYEALSVLRDNSLLKENSALKRILGIQDDHVDAQTAAGASRDDAGQSVHVADTLPASEPDEDNEFPLAGPEYVAKMKQKEIDINTKIKQIRPLLIRLHEWVGSFSETGEFAGVDRIEAQKIANLGEEIVELLSGPYDYNRDKRHEDAMKQFANLRSLIVTQEYDLAVQAKTLYDQLSALAEAHKILVPNLELPQEQPSSSPAVQAVNLKRAMRVPRFGLVAATVLASPGLDGDVTTGKPVGSDQALATHAPADSTSEQGSSPESNYSIRVDSKLGTKLSRAIVQEGDGISNCLLRYEKDKDNSSRSDDDNHDFPAGDNLQGTGLSLDEVAMLLKKLGIDETRGLREAAIGNYAIGWEQNGEQPELKIYTVVRDTSGAVVGFEPKADGFIEKITYPIEK